MGFLFHPVKYSIMNDKLDIVKATDMEGDFRILTDGKNFKVQKLMDEGVFIINKKLVWKDMTYHNEAFYSYNNGIVSLFCSKEQAELFIERSKTYKIKTEEPEWKVC